MRQDKVGVEYLARALLHAGYPPVEGHESRVAFALQRRRVMRQMIRVRARPVDGVARIVDDAFILSELNSEGHPVGGAHFGQRAGFRRVVAGAADGRVDIGAVAAPRMHIVIGLRSRGGENILPQRRASVGRQRSSVPQCGGQRANRAAVGAGEFCLVFRREFALGKHRRNARFGFRYAQPAFGRAGSADRQRIARLAFGGGKALSAGINPFRNIALLRRVGAQGDERANGNAHPAGQFNSRPFRAQRAAAFGTPPEVQSGDVVRAYAVRSQRIAVKVLLPRFAGGINRVAQFHKIISGIATSSRVFTRRCQLRIQRGGHRGRGGAEIIFIRRKTRNGRVGMNTSDSHSFAVGERRNGNKRGIIAQLRISAFAMGLRQRRVQAINIRLRRRGQRSEKSRMRH